MKRSGIHLLTKFASQDFVTEILRSVTLKTVVFGRAELRAPWGLHVDLPGRAVFHIVLRGEGWLKLQSGNHVRLNCGDTILFPRADAHNMNDHPATPIRPLQELLVQHPMTPDRRFCYGGRGLLTTMLCGAFQLDDPKINLLGVLLPAVLHIKSGAGNTAPQLRSLLDCIETELKTSQPGEQAIVTRMAEAFLLRAIRDYVLSSTNGDHGLPAILRDPSIGRALGALHQRPEHAWTVASLADEANLSRSGFAARFRVRVGTTPQRYLQRYRFSKALQLLQKHGRQDLRHRSPRGVRLRVFFQQGVQTLMGKAPGAYR